MRSVLFTAFQGKFKRIASVVLTIAATLLAVQTPANAQDTYTDIEQNIRTSMAVGNQLKALVEPTAGFVVKVVSAERWSNDAVELG